MEFADLVCLVSCCAGSGAELTQQGVGLDHEPAPLQPHARGGLIRLLVHCLGLLRLQAETLEAQGVDDEGRRRNEMDRRVGTMETHKRTTSLARSELQRQVAKRLACFLYNTLTKLPKSTYGGAAPLFISSVRLTARSDTDTVVYRRRQRARADDR